jgi:hypothetical protein
MLKVRTKMIFGERSDSLDLFEPRDFFTLLSLLQINNRSISHPSDELRARWDLGWGEDEFNRSIAIRRCVDVVERLGRQGKMEIGGRERERERGGGGGGRSIIRVESSTHQRKVRWGRIGKTDDAGLADGFSPSHTPSPAAAAADQVSIPLNEQAQGQQKTNGCHIT